MSSQTFDQAFSKSWVIRMREFWCSNYPFTTINVLILTKTLVKKYTKPVIYQSNNTSVWRRQVIHQICWEELKEGTIKTVKLNEWREYLSVKVFIEVKRLLNCYIWKNMVFIEAIL